MKEFGAWFYEVFFIWKILIINDPNVDKFAGSVKMMILNLINVLIVQTKV